MNNFADIFTTTNLTPLTWLFMYATALLGGIIASISPCSLAMLPLIIGYVGGCSKETPVRTFFQLCSFILGTSIVLFVSLNLTNISLSLMIFTLLT